MSDDAERIAEQLGAFQNIWQESMSKIMQAAFASGAQSPPPEMLREMRAGIFQALARTWEEYMRSPQFLEAMKQTMDNAIAFRQQTNNFMAKVRNELQAPSREDTEAVLLAIRHLETRLLDRVEDLERAVGELGARPSKAKAAKPSVNPARKTAGKARPATRKRRKP